MDVYTSKSKLNITFGKHRFGWPFRQRIVPRRTLIFPSYFNDGFSRLISHRKSGRPMKMQTPNWKRTQQRKKRSFFFLFCIVCKFDMFKCWISRWRRWCYRGNGTFIEYGDGNVLHVWNFIWLAFFIYINRLYVGYIVVQ